MQLLKLFTAIAVFAVSAAAVASPEIVKLRDLEERAANPELATPPNSPSE
ncbi:hypothetical protein ASPCADRAFT_5137 [Aspergillus carbonarius ITEM 5010]|uniref:Uncharacterized protein n=1 Tax=Aspergillus carbonarius (strain ITEM 5010) TaxID=602072 RepID=A0A1R3RMY5_ASPC5|nr:hypothetical protein ASPCADRAFT_5137 [Aspergillus carbonarius ITEM 5010]